MITFTVFPNSILLCNPLQFHLLSLREIVMLRSPVPIMLIVHVSIFIFFKCSATFEKCFSNISLKDSFHPLLLSLWYNILGFFCLVVCCFGGFFFYFESLNMGTPWSFVLGPLSHTDAGGWNFPVICGGGRGFLGHFQKPPWEDEVENVICVELHFLSSKVSCPLSLSWKRCSWNFCCLEV